MKMSYLFSGRKKDMVIRSGYNINPAEIDRFLAGFLICQGMLRSRDIKRYGLWAIPGIIVIPGCCLWAGHDALVYDEDYNPNGCSYKPYEMLENYNRSEAVHRLSKEGVKLKKIAFIIPYFGRFPDYFELWLHSCKYNESIDWLIFTDNRTRYNYPANVKVYYISFKKMQEILQKCFDFPIVIKDRYKMCDFRPVYGLAFQEWIREYDFWGYCDVDLIFGNIRKFISDDILSVYKKIFKEGHFTLIKNDVEANNFFKLTAEGYLDYKTVFTSNNCYFFDEWGGITPILDANGVPQYYENIFADPLFCYDHFYLHFIDCNYVPQVFIWENGTLYRKYFEKGRISEQEFLYLHLQKRRMKMTFSFSPNIKRFMIGPHQFFFSDLTIDYEALKKINPFKLLYFWWLKRTAVELTYEKINRTKSKIYGFIRSLWPVRDRIKSTD